jgi:hypothetical protein
MLLPAASLGLLSTLVVVLALALTGTEFPHVAQEVWFLLFIVVVPLIALAGLRLSFRGVNEALRVNVVGATVSASTLAVWGVIAYLMVTRWGQH